MQKTTKTVEINMEQVIIRDRIMAQLKQANMPMFAKKLGVRLLPIFIDKKQGKLWFRLTLLCNIRRTTLNSDVFDALNRLKAAKIIDYQRVNDEVVSIEFKAW